MKIALACAGFGAAALAAVAYSSLDTDATVEPLRAVELTADVTVSGKLDPRMEQHADYVIDLPAGVVTARFDVVGSGADLSASLRFGEPIDDDSEVDFFLYAVDGRIPLRVTRQSDPAVRPGRCYVRVQAHGEDAAISSDGRVHPVPFTLLPRVWTASADAVLEIGTSLVGEIPARGAGHRTLRVDVPPGSIALRIDVVQTDADVDLHAACGAPAARFDAFTETAAHAYGRETLVLKGEGSAPLRSGAWFVDVNAPLDDERPVRFEVLATLSADTPAALTAIPPLALTAPRTLPELARAVAAVVELTTEDASGSGTIVNADGWILTNAHVVEGPNGAPVDDVVVACTTVPERPAIEMFRGRVERFDIDLDLALVHVTTGFYGQPIPADYRFPTVDIVDASTLLVGSPLWLVGYPATGGEGSRVTIHATRGVVAGFEHGAAGDLVKTDAAITQGNSGGAALDGAGRLVGVPSSTVDNGLGQSGFVRPVDLMPAEWRTQIARPR